MSGSIGSEVLRVATVFTVPAILMSIFPYAALEFRATQPPPRTKATVAYVRLDATAEHQAIKAAKSTFRGEGSQVQRLRADLFFGELPEEPIRPTLPKPVGLAAPTAATLDFGVPVYRPAAAAAAPAVIPAMTPSILPPTFSRKEMLDIDERK